MIELVHVPCRCCGAAEEAADPIYAREQDGGSVLGRIRVQLVQCGSCGFVQMSPRPSPSDLVRHYTESHDASGAVFRETGAGSAHARMGDERVSFIQSKLAAWSTTEGESRLLEIGCGRGDLLRRLAPPGWRAVGLEPDADAARVARAAGCEVVEGLLEANGLEPRSFDAIAAFSVLEHLDDPGLAADRLAQLCREGGLLLLQVPDSCQPRAQVGEYYSYEHLSHFTAHTLVSMFQERGFTLLEDVLEKEGGGLSLVARKGHANSTLEVPDDRAVVRRVIEEYAEERAEFERRIRTRLSPKLEAWRARDARVGVYGAGAHTRFLFDLVPLRELAVCLLDGDERKQGKHFAGLPIWSPDAADDLDAVVLSSEAFEDQMAERLKRFATAGVEIVRLYS